MFAVKMQNPHARGPSGSRSVRSKRLKLLSSTFVVLAAWSSSAMTAAAEPWTTQRAEVASELSDPYRLGGKQLDCTPHPDRFDALTASADAQVAALGELLAKREEQRNKIRQTSVMLRKQLQQSAQQVQGAIIGYALGEFFGGERSTREQMKDIVEGVKDPVTDVLELQQELYTLSLQEIQHEAEIRKQLRELRAPLVAAEGAAKDLYITFRLDPKRHQFATMSVKNRGPETLHHVLVLVEMDCKYDPDGAKDTLNALGGAMLLGMGVSAGDTAKLTTGYIQRDRAQAAFEDIDKGYAVYLDTWSPSATLEMDIHSALSLVKYTQSAKLTIVSDELTVVDHECPLDLGKKKLVADLKAESARQKKLAMARAKNPQKVAKPKKKAPPKRRR